MTASDGSTALDIQIGGEHYKSAKIQPVQYIEANGLGFLEGCVVKRLTRHNKPTGKGRQDIEKAIHELQLLLEFRYPAADLPCNKPVRSFHSDPMPEPAAAMEDDSARMQAIGQNGNDGAIYREPAYVQTAVPGVKYCDGCGRNVFFCTCEC